MGEIFVAISEYLNFTYLSKPRVLSLGVPGVPWHTQIFRPSDGPVSKQVSKY